MPLLQEGSAGIAALRQEAIDLGITLSDEDAAAAAAFTDAMNRAWRQLKAFTQQLGAAIAGPLTAFLSETKAVAATILNWVRANKPLVASIFAVGVALTAAGAGFITLGGMFALLGVAAGGFASAIGVIGTVIGALLSPVGLLITGLAGLATWFATSTEHGRVMVANLSAWFAELAATAKRIFGSITSALSMGELGLAAEVALAALHVAWLEGTKTIHDAWLDFKDLFMKTTIEMVHEATKEFAKITAFVKKTWTEATTLSAQIGERIGHALTASDDPNQRKYDDAASEERVQGIRAEGDAKINAIGNDLESQLNAIEKNRADTQAAQDKEAKDAKTAAEAARDAAMERLRQAEREVEQKRREVAREKAEEVAPLMPELQKAVAAGMGDSEFKGAGGLFDTRFARQMLVGPQDRQEQLLGKIEKNTRGNGGIAVV